MNHKKNLVIFLFLASITLLGCGKTEDIKPMNQEQIPFNVPTDPPQPLGGDRDEHGCIPSAGYQWNEAKQLCVRPWEEEAYYENFKEKCNGSSCCLSSVDNAEQAASQVYEEKSLNDVTCPEGFNPDMNKCVDSYIWCSPVNEK